MDHDDSGSFTLQWLTTASSGANWCYKLRRTGPGWFENVPIEPEQIVHMNLNPACHAAPDHITPNMLSDGSIDRRMDDEEVSYYFPGLDKLRKLWNNM